MWFSEENGKLDYLEWGVRDIITVATWHRLNNVD